MANNWVGLGWCTACGLAEEPETNSTIEQNATQSVGAEAVIELDADLLQGVAAGEWGERLATAEKGSPFELKRQVKASAELAQGVRENPEEYMAVTAAYGDSRGEGTFKYIRRVPTVIEQREHKSPPADAVATAPWTGRKTEAQLDEAVARMEAGELVPVLITLTDDLPTNLSPPVIAVEDFQMDATAARHSRREEVSRLVEQRTLEAVESQAGLVRELKALGAEVEAAGSIWIANTVEARIDPLLIDQLIRRDDVALIELNTVPGLSGLGWSGEDLRASSDFNGGHYYNAGQDGEEPNPITGRSDLTVAIMDRDFNPSHPVFKDGSGSASRFVAGWNCDINPCFPLLPPAGGDYHGTSVASVAAGDATDGQISGSSSAREKRSGVAREAGIIMLHAGPAAAALRAAQRAIDSEADVLSISLGGTSPCTGAASSWNTAVWQAESAGLLVVSAAGNGGDSASSCTFQGSGNAPSAMAVGDMFGDGTLAYSAVDLAPSSSTGPVGAWIDGTYYSSAFTQVGVSVMGYSQYCAVGGTAFDACAGTRGCP